MEYIIYTLLVWNFLVFVLYGIDKWKAKKEKRRIRESTLLLCAFLFGAVGAVFGMLCFRHKTRHWKFRILVPLAVLVDAVAYYGVYILLSGK